MPSQLELDFHKAMIGIFHSAKDAGYPPTRFLRLVNELGGVEAARKLINSQDPADGFTELWKLGRLDITVEALVQDLKWSPLFDPTEIERAKQRLRDYDYDV